MASDYLRPGGHWLQPKSLSAGQIMIAATAMLLAAFVLFGHYTDCNQPWATNSLPLEAGSSSNSKFERAQQLTAAKHATLPTPSSTANRTCAVALPPETFFSVYGFDFTDTSGGITVMHFLADRLNRLYGHVEPVAFMYDSNSTNPAWATPPLPPWRNASKAIAIYPEVRGDNPMGASKIIRWILWFPGGNGGPAAADYNPDDLIACYSPGICTQFGSKYTVRPLRLIDYGLDYLHDLPAVPSHARNGTVVYHGKTRWRRQSEDKPFERDYTRFHPINGPNVTVLPRSMSKRQRLELFSRAEYFYSYDAGTWRNVEAALAGAKSIVLPVERVDKQEWMSSIYGVDEVQYGIAYGVEDLPHATATQQLLLPSLKRRALEQERELQEFVAQTCMFFNLKCTYEQC